MSAAPAWQIGPFSRRGEVLRQQPGRFTCPLRSTSVAWAAKDVFNPAAVVRDDQVHLLFRAEDAVGPYNGTSRVGLAVSDDGVTFEVAAEPVLYPEPDAWQPWEWPGGCEDPRLVESPDGGYVCLYTAFDGKASCLFVATSDDLVHWQKHGPAFAGSRYARRWSKSGAIVTETTDGRLKAAKLGDHYLMYWGEGTCFAATSPDLVRWTPVEFDAGADRYVSYKALGAQGSWDVHHCPRNQGAAPAVVPPARALRLASGRARPPGRTHRRRHRPPLQRGRGHAAPKTGRRSTCATSRGRRSSIRLTRSRRSPGLSPRSCGVTNPGHCRARWTTSASRRASCSFTTLGTSTTAWPTHGSGAPRRRGSGREQRHQEVCADAVDQLALSGGLPLSRGVGRMGRGAGGCRGERRMTT